MKLIDVDRFLKDYGHHHTESMSPYLDREKLHAFNDGIDFMVDMLKDESESVVRCKDCKYAYSRNCPMCYEVNHDYDRWTWRELVSNAMDNWYCSRGERKND